MIRSRDRTVPALGAVAAVFFLIALFLRPNALPPGSANYAAIPLPAAMPADTHRVAAAGVTYAIDSLEVNGIQLPINGLAPVRTSSPIVVHGWAVNAATLAPGRALLIGIDGGALAPVTTYGIARPDVAAAINPAAANSGFAASVPAAGLHNGTHTIRFVIEDQTGKRTQLPTAVSFTLLH